MLGPRNGFGDFVAIGRLCSAMLTCIVAGCLKLLYIDNKLLLHVDLYRIESQEDVEVLNLDRDTFNQKIVFIEWPENLQTDRQEDVIINLEHDKQARCASLICKDNNIESSIKTYYGNN